MDTHPTADNIVGAGQPLGDPAERERLLKGAIDADAETETSTQDASQEEVSPTKTPSKAAQPKSGDTDATGALSPETSAGAKDAAGQARDKDGKFVKQGTEEQQQQQPQPGQEPAKPTREERDKQRYDRNWERLNRRSQALAQREQQIQAAWEQLNRPGQESAATRPRFSYQQYLQARDNFLSAAQQAYRDGDTTQGDEQMRLAGEAENEAYNSYASEQQAYQSQMIAAHTEAWRANAQEILKDHPEYDDETTEEFADMAELLEEYPVLFSMPDGFKAAFDLLQMRKSHAEVSGLREQLDKANKEVQRLNKLLAPNTGIEIERHGDMTPFEKLPPEKQRDLLEKDAAALDAATA